MKEGNIWKRCKWAWSKKYQQESQSDFIKG